MKNKYIMNKISLCYIVLCYNESFNIPWVLDYWKRIKSQIDDFKVVVIDNHSTDSSVEMLSKYDWIEIRYFESDGHNDIVHQQVKDKVWREYKDKYTFIFVGDFDEILWSNNLKEELQKMLDGNYNLLLNKWYALAGYEIPTYTEGKYLHQLIKYGYRQYINHTKGFDEFGKFLLFNTKAVDNISWSVGQHILFDIKPNLKLFYSDKIVTFHICNGYSEDYFVNKRKKQFQRLSNTNKKFGMGVEYSKSEQESREEYKNNQAKAIDISNL